MQQWAKGAPWYCNVISCSHIEKVQLLNQLHVMHDITVNETPIKRAAGIHSAHQSTSCMHGTHTHTHTSLLSPSTRSHQPTPNKLLVKTICTYCAVFALVVVFFTKWGGYGYRIFEGWQLGGIGGTSLTLLRTAYWLNATSWRINAGLAYISPVLHARIMPTLWVCDTPEGWSWCINAAPASHSPWLHWCIMTTCGIF